MRELYLVAKYGPERVERKGKAISKFLTTLGLASFEGSEGEFYSALSLALLEKLSLLKALEAVASSVACISPAAIAEAARKVDVELSRTSARNLFRLLAQLGFVTRHRAWATYTPGLEDAVLAVVAAKGETRVEEIEKRLGSGVRESLLKLWAKGLLEIEGDNRGPLRGPLKLPRELVLEHGLVYPESVVKAMSLESNPRLERFVERETGEVKYAVALRGDDRVRVVVR